MKMCLVGSAGGHWEELMCIREITDGHECFYVTEEGRQVEDSTGDKIYLVPRINRHEKYFPVHFVKLFHKAHTILRKEKPDIIVTTGALIAFPFCVCGKMMKSKIIYIESFARVYNASLTGRLVYGIADMFLVQSEELLKVYPRAKYVGGVF